MITFLLILLANGLIAAVVGAVIYHFRCGFVEQLLTTTCPDYIQDRLGHDKWKKTFSSLEFGRVGFGLVSIGGFGLGVAGVLGLQFGYEYFAGYDWLASLTIAVLGLSIVYMVWRTVTHSERLHSSKGYGVSYD